MGKENLESLTNQINELTQQLIKANKQDKLNLVKQLTSVQSDYFELKRKQLNITEEEFNQAAEHLAKKMK